MPWFCKTLITYLSVGFISLTNVYTQTPETTQRLDQFVKENSKVTYTEITSEATEHILKHKVYCIALETSNIYDDPGRDLDEFIVIDDGTDIQSCQKLKKNTSMAYFLGHLHEDFTMTPATAPLFQDLLDILYPVEDWKLDKREFFFKNGKWYFLRDAYMRSMQGFEITVDPEGKIIDMRYKMKWDVPDRS
jgi:hypothetical protein